MLITIDHTSTFTKNTHILDIPSTIVWSQTLETITLKIDIHHVEFRISERCLQLCNKNKTITLPLYGHVHVQQEHNALRINNMIITLKKERSVMWPHLLVQQTDKEIERYLLEANFLVHIDYQASTDMYDILDFDTVINGHGEKTGLE
ncbi:hypothetical protein CU098_013879 [Rhizopus stolonifer]|uniref:CS domain-containing protein n=1 Tax=Rhizopus stolonifer TaxID=4846 RepID=A0A367KWS3_RHIST|nr:hypothetical protein CU098_013879 [Rhizopus stolonifer]